MEANIYRVFRNIVSDTASDYSVVDLLALSYLDKALDKLSSVSDYIFKESVQITQSDINNGYKEFSREIVSIRDGWLSGHGTLWQYDGGKKIRFIDTSNIQPQTLTVTYRARYAKFNGEVKQQSAMDLPQEAELPVVLYATGLHARAISGPDADGSLRIIREKSEENMRVTYGMGGVTSELSDPQAMLDRAVDMMRELPSAQEISFSVKV